MVAPRSDTPSYANDVRPIFERHCTGCHGGFAPGGSYVMSSYEQIMQSGTHAPNVVAGDMQSNLLRMIRGEMITAGSQMPPDALMSAEEISIVARWVETGAQP